MPRRLFLSIAALVGSTVLAVAAAELPAALHLVDYRLVLRTAPALGRTRPWLDPRNVPDSSLLWKHRPNQHLRGEAHGDLVDLLGLNDRPRYPFEVRYDSLGFRNPAEITSADVALIGDSFLEWPLLADSELVSAELSRRMGLVVANLGHSGYGPNHQLIVLRRYAPPLRPRVVVWFLFEGNDLSDLSTWRHLVRDWPLSARHADSFRERSFVTNATRLLRGLTAPRVEGGAEEARRRSCVVRGSARPDTLWFFYGGEPLSPADLRNLDTLYAILGEATALAQSTGARLVLALLPTKFRVYRTLCEFPEDGRGRSWMPDDLPERVGEWAAARGVPVIDLTPALVSRADGGPSVYFADDDHLSPAGTRAVADTLALMLRALAVPGGGTRTPQPEQ